MVDISDDMTATQDWLPLEEADALATEPGFYQLDSEYLVVAGIHMTRPGRRPSAGNRPNGRACARGAEGSTAATHSSGATLTRYYPDAPGGGVANPLTEDLDADGNSITNAANLATLVTDPGNVWEAETAYAEGDIVDDGDGGIHRAGNSGTSGMSAPEWAYPTPASYSPTTTDNDIGWVYVGTVGTLAVDTSTPLPGALPFYAALTGAQQTVPLTNPTVQNVIDALVALGLVVQTD